MWRYRPDPVTGLAVPKYPYDYRLPDYEIRKAAKQLAMRQRMLHRVACGDEPATPAERRAACRTLWPYLEPRKRLKRLKLRARLIAQYAAEGHRFRQRKRFDQSRLWSSDKHNPALRADV